MVLADIEFRDYFSFDQIADYLTLFQKYDADSSGEIDYEEMCNMFKELGQDFNRNMVRQVLEMVDTDGSGSIDFEEFCVMLIRLLGSQPKAKLIKHQEYLDPKEILDLELVFESYDIDVEGVLRREQLECVLDDLGYKVKQDMVDKIFEEVDTDKSGTLEFDEFASMWTILRKKKRRINYREYFSNEVLQQFRSTFDFFDTSKDGFIDAEELDSMFRRLGMVLRKERIQQLMNEEDQDRSGHIDFNEFCVMMVKLRGQKKKVKISPETTTVLECLKNMFTIDELIASGFTVEHLKPHIAISKLIQQEYFRPIDFRRAGYTSKELRKGGLGPYNLRRSGYSLTDLRTAGYSHQMISQVNKTIHSRMSQDDFCLAHRHPVKDDYEWKHAAQTPRIRHHVDYRPKRSFENTVRVGMQVINARRTFKSMLDKNRRNSQDSQNAAVVTQGKNSIL